MNSRIFETWIETQLVPTLSAGDIVILDNVGFHKSQKAEQLVKAKGAWFLFLPPYSPDLNPIEMAFSKLKALLRKRAARSFDAISKALGDIISLFSINECQNFFKSRTENQVERFQEFMILCGLPRLRRITWPGLKPPGETRPEVACAMQAIVPTMSGQLLRRFCSRWAKSAARASMIHAYCGTQS